MSGYGLNSSGSGWRPVVAAVNISRTFGFHNGEGFLDVRSNC